MGRGQGAEGRGPPPCGPHPPALLSQLSCVDSGAPPPPPSPSQPEPPTPPPGLPSASPLLTLISARLSADPSETEFAFPPLGSFLLASKKDHSALSPDLPARGDHSGKRDVPAWATVLPRHTGTSAPTQPAHWPALCWVPGREVGCCCSLGQLLGADPPSPGPHVWDIPTRSLNLPRYPWNLWKRWRGPCPWPVCDTDVGDALEPGSGARAHTTRRGHI